jgi:hypothetical protein
MEKEDPKESNQELSAIFSHANFPPDANKSVDENQLESNLGITMPQICMTKGEIFSWFLHIAYSSFYAYRI